MDIVPIKFKEACLFVKKHHRHHLPPAGHVFSLACAVDEDIVGVAIVGRPIARTLDNGLTAEVTRLCTDGTKNACSMLYAAAWRAARAIGYKKLIAYILNTEKGTSLTAAGWTLVGECGGGSWNCKSRPRVDRHPQQKKLRFEVTNDKGKTED